MMPKSIILGKICPCSCSGLLNFRSSSKICVPEERNMERRSEWVNSPSFGMLGEVCKKKRIYLGLFPKHRTPPTHRASIHAKNVWCCGDGYFGQKKIAEKVRKSRQNVNCDKSALIVKIDKNWWKSTKNGENWQKMVLFPSKMVLLPSKMVLPPS